MAAVAVASYQGALLPTHARHPHPPQGPASSSSAAGSAHTHVHHGAGVGIGIAAGHASGMGMGSGSGGSAAAAASTGPISGPSTSSGLVPAAAGGSHHSNNHTPLRRAFNVHNPKAPPSAAAGASSSSNAAINAQHHQVTSAASAAVAHHHQHYSVESYYGHEEAAKTCARFVAHTFGCPELLPPPSSSSGSGSGSGTSSAAPALPSSAPNVPGTLAHFVAYALHRTRLPPAVTTTALALLHRLKTRFPHARGSSGHRLFLSAFMLASKVVCDDTYSNKSWAVVGQGLFALREVNQMEREMCSYLEWQLNVPREDLDRFEAEVKRVFGRNGAIARGDLSGIPMLLNNGVGGKPFAPSSTASAMTPPPTAVVQQSSAPTTPAPAVPAKDAHQSTSPQQLPTPTEAGATQIPFVRSGSSASTASAAHAAAAALLGHHRAMPYPSPPTTPPSPSASASMRTLGAQHGLRPATVPAFPSASNQYPIIIPGPKPGKTADDSDSDSESECSDEDDEDDETELGGRRRMRVSDSPSPSASSTSTASEGSTVRTPPSAKAPGSYHTKVHHHPQHSHSHAHQAGPASYGGLVKSFSLPPNSMHPSGSSGNGNVQRSQTMSASEFGAHYPQAQRGAFVGAYSGATANAMVVDTSNGSEAEYVGVVSSSSTSSSQQPVAKKAQATAGMPRTFTVPCGW